MKTLNYYLYGLLSCSIAIACTSIPHSPEKSLCSSMDWYEIGRGTGIKGQPMTSLEEKTKTCKNLSMEDRDLFWHGWNLGVESFCSAEHGFALGQSGQGYSAVCPEGIAQNFETAYHKGLKVFLMEKDNQALAKQIDAIHDRIVEGEIDEIPFADDLNVLRQKRIANAQNIEQIKKTYDSTN